MAFNTDYLIDEIVDRVPDGQGLIDDIQRMWGMRSSLRSDIEYAVERGVEELRKEVAEIVEREVNERHLNMQRTAAAHALATFVRLTLGDSSADTITPWAINHGTTADFTRIAQVAHTEATVHAIDHATRF